MSEMIPAQFWMDTPWLRCNRPECDWRHHADREALTELVAVAREHVEEAHRD